MISIKCVIHNPTSLQPLTASASYFELVFSHAGVLSLGELCSLTTKNEDYGTYQAHVNRCVSWTGQTFPASATHGVASFLKEP